MAVRHFNGTSSDVISFTPPPYFTGAFTWIAVHKRDNLTGWRALMNITDNSFAPNICFEFTDSNGLQWYFAPNDVQNSLDLGGFSWVTLDDWCIVAVTYDGSGSVYRFHAFDGTDWYHGNHTHGGGSSTADYSNWVTVGGAVMKFGQWSSSFNYFNGKMAMQALNNDTALSDGALEALAGATKEDYAAAGFDNLWELNQLSTATAITDFIGDCDQTAISGTSVITDDDPPSSIYLFEAPAATPTLHFDGTDDYVGGTGQGAMNGTITVAALAKRVSITTSDTLVATNSSVPAAGFQFGLHANDRTFWYNDNTGTAIGDSLGTEPHTTITDWWIVVLTRTAGATTVRFHVKNITTDGDWSHSNGGFADTGNPDSASGGAVDIGRFHLPGVGDFDFFDGDIALVAWWEGIAFSDGQVEALDGGATSAWQDHAAGAPSSITELTSTTPVDLSGLVTWTTSGATATGDSPPGWDFDGVEEEGGATYTDSATGSIIASGTGDEEYVPPAFVGTVGPLVITLVDDAGNTVDGTVEARLRAGGSFSSFTDEAATTTATFPFDSTSGIAILWLEVGKYEWRATVDGNTTAWMPVDVPGVS